LSEPRLGLSCSRTDFTATRRQARCTVS
jgi:hypothetical protein